MDIDQARLMEFLHKFVGDLGATMAAGNVLVGDRLGFYRVLAEHPMQPQELAGRTGGWPATPGTHGSAGSRNALQHRLRSPAVAAQGSR